MDGSVKKTMAPLSVGVSIGPTDVSASAGPILLVRAAQRRQCMPPGKPASASLSRAICDCAFGFAGIGGDGSAFGLLALVNAFQRFVDHRVGTAHAGRSAVIRAHDVVAALWACSSTRADGRARA